MSDDVHLTGPAPIRMSEQAPKAELLSSLGKLARGLSALFWGLPVALVVCVQTARGDWLRPLGVVPPLCATGLLLYALTLLSQFQPQERVWTRALDRAKIFGLINFGLSPFLYWWSRLPSNEFFTAILDLLAVCSLAFLFALNPVLCRLTAMLPDEALRLETKLFTNLNCCLLSLIGPVLIAYFVLSRLNPVPRVVTELMGSLDRYGLWLALVPMLFILMPVAITMALLWKIKEIILASVFGGEH
jgi:hypothetical protein